MYQHSGLGQQPLDYAAAKAGVIGLTMDAAAYLAPMGVRVNAISPGGFERGQPQAFIERVQRRHCLGAHGPRRHGSEGSGALFGLARRRLHHRAQLGGGRRLLHLEVRGVSQYCAIGGPKTRIFRSKPWAENYR